MKEERPKVTEGQAPHGRPNPITATVLRCMASLVVLRIAYWWWDSNRMPVDTSPTLSMPKPNGYDYFVRATKATVNTTELIDIYCNKPKSVTYPPGSSIPGWGGGPPGGGPPGFGGSGLPPGAVPPKVIPYTLRDKIDLVERNAKPPGAVPPKVIPYTLRDKIDLVARNAKALRILREGLRYECRVPPNITWDLPDGPPGIPNRALLIVEGRARLEQGHDLQCLASFLDLAMLGRVYTRGAHLATCVRGLHYMAWAREEIRGAAPVVEVRALRAFCRRWERFSQEPVPYLRNLIEETRSLQRQTLKVMHKEDWRSEFVKELPLPGPEFLSYRMKEWLARVRLSWYSKREIYRNLTRYSDQYINRARRGYALRGSLPSLPRDPVSENVLWIISDDGFWASFLQHDAQNALLATQLALRCWKLGHGTYPPSLHALVPSHLQQVPKDPFADARELRYARTTKGYLLYSIGPDGKDDGGRTIVDSSRRKWKYIVRPGSKGDIVAGRNDQ